ncbi:hypothetical protein LguiA_011488 [Lonicera macranthoides]
MASVVCQGLQSCLEPRLVEPLVLRHQLSPSNSSLSPTFLWPNSPKQHKQEEDPRINENNEDADFKNDNKNGESGGWSFIQSLTNSTPQLSKEESDQKVYVHPLDKTSSTTLSLKSLEMCTERLGSESGSDISESSDEFSSLSWEGKKIKRLELTKKPSLSASFPPPLTSISGSRSVRVRPHREDGRLVIRAENVSSSSSCFQADRTNGRLRLSFLKDCCMNCESNEVIKKKEAEFIEEVEEENENDVEEEEEEIYGGDDDGDNNDDESESENDEDYCWGEDTEENINVGSENGIGGELARPSRCKENGNGNKGMPIWGPYCVAIS